MRKLACSIQVFPLKYSVMLFLSHGKVYSFPNFTVTPESHIKVMRIKEMIIN